MVRKYLPTLGELIDRLSILQIKEIKIPNHKKEYQKEIKDIIHDINQYGITKIMHEMVLILIIN